MKNEARKNELRSLISQYQRELLAIDDGEMAEIANYHLGKCYKYKNSYSCPKDETDYSWLYMKVTGVNGRYVKTMSFQTDRYAEISIKTEESPANSISLGYELISEDEFNAAWKSLMADIAATGESI